MLLYKKVVAKSVDIDTYSIGDTRRSMQLNTIQHPEKIIRSCMLSKQIYNNNKRFSLHRHGSSLYVCFKGCTSKKDLISGMDIRKAKILGETIDVHNGFYQHYADLSKELDYNLLNICSQDDVYNIVFTGHSAGGCIGQIASVITKQKLLNEADSKKVHCISYGSPKLGNIDFKHMIENVLAENLLRVETFNDIVCLLPMHASFQHAGNALILRNGDFIVTDEIESFYNYYYSDYLSFVQQLNSSNLLDKNSLSDMIDGHYSENYVKNIHKFFKKYMKDI